MSDSRLGFYDRLFRFCMDAGTSPEAPAGESNPEDMKWLKQVLDEAVVSPIDIVKGCMNALEREAKTDEERDLRLQSIITMNEWLEDVDVTKDFLRLGKLSLIERLLQDEQPCVKLEACRLVSCIAQNYEDAQKMLCAETDVMGLLANIVRTDSSEDHKAKALSALRCLVENNEELLNRFLSDTYRGYDLLSTALTSNHRDLQGRAAMFLNTIVDSKKEELTRRDFAALLQQAYAQRPWHYHKYLLLQALRGLLKDNPKLIKTCKKNGLPCQIRSMVGSIPDEEDSTADKQVADEVLEMLEKK